MSKREKEEQNSKNSNSSIKNKKIKISEGREFVLKSREKMIEEYGLNENRTISFKRFKYSDVKHIVEKFEDRKNWWAHQWCASGIRDKKSIDKENWEPRNGWKFHVSIDATNEQCVEDAWELFCDTIENLVKKEQDRPHSKIAIQESLAMLSSNEEEQRGKVISLYDSGQPINWAAICLSINTKFLKQHIKKGLKVFGEKQVNGSKYLSYRNESNGDHTLYISAQNVRNMKLKNGDKISDETFYNFSNREEKYDKIDVSVSNVLVQKDITEEKKEEIVESLSEEMLIATVIYTTTEEKWDELCELFKYSNRACKEKIIELMDSKSIKEFAEYLSGKYNENHPEFHIMGSLYKYSFNEDRESIEEFTTLDKKDKLFIEKIDEKSEDKNIKNFFRLKKIKENSKFILNLVNKNNSDFLIKICNNIRLDKILNSEDQIKIVKLLINKVNGKKICSEILCNLNQEDIFEQDEFSNVIELIENTKGRLEFLKLLNKNMQKKIIGLLNDETRKKLFTKSLNDEMTKDEIKFSSVILPEKIDNDIVEKITNTDITKHLIHCLIDQQRLDTIYEILRFEQKDGKLNKSIIKKIDRMDKIFVAQYLAGLAGENGDFSEIIYYILCIKENDLENIVNNMYRKNYEQEVQFWSKLYDKDKENAFNVMIHLRDLSVVKEKIVKQFIEHTIKEYGDKNEINEILKRTFISHKKAMLDAVQSNGNLNKEKVHTTQSKNFQLNIKFEEKNIPLLQKFIVSLINEKDFVILKEVLNVINDDTLINVSNNSEVNYHDFYRKLNKNENFFDLNYFLSTLSTISKKAKSFLDKRKGNYENFAKYRDFISELEYYKFYNYDKSPSGDDRLNCLKNDWEDIQQKGPERRYFVEYIINNDVKFELNNPTDKNSPTEKNAKIEKAKILVSFISDISGELSDIINKLEPSVIAKHLKNIHFLLKEEYNSEDTSEKENLNQKLGSFLKNIKREKRILVLDCLDKKEIFNLMLCSIDKNEKIFSSLWNSSQENIEEYIISKLKEKIQYSNEDSLKMFKKIFDNSNEERKKEMFNKLSEELSTNAAKFICCDKDEDETKLKNFMKFFTENASKEQFEHFIKNIYLPKKRKKKNENFKFKKDIYSILEQLAEKSKKEHKANLAYFKKHKEQFEQNMLESKEEFEKNLSRS